MYYKIIGNNIITAIGTSSAINEPQIAISESEYNSLMEVIQTKPEDTDTIIYKLHADTLEYVAYDRPEEPTPIETDPEIDSIISEVANSGY